MDSTREYVNASSTDSPYLTDTERFAALYNTYKCEALPAGPICSPSLSSIKAAIYPNQTDYYFYALGKDGVHHFFKTYAEHLNFINSSDYQSIG